jgi:hypothetical protein
MAKPKWVSKLIDPEEFWELLGHAFKCVVIIVIFSIPAIVAKYGISDPVVRTRVEQIDGYVIVCLFGILGLKIIIVFAKGLFS